LGKLGLILRSSKKVGGRKKNKTQRAQGRLGEKVKKKKGKNKRKKEKWKRTKTRAQKFNPRRG